MAGMMCELTLISQTIAKDAHQTVTLHETPVYAEKKPLYSGEFHNAKARGKDLQHIMLIHAYEYSGQSRARFDGQEYEIYRHYQPNSDWVELYLSTKEASTP